MARLLEPGNPSTFTRKKDNGVPVERDAGLWEVGEDNGLLAYCVAGAVFAGNRRPFTVTRHARNGSISS